MVIFISEKELIKDLNKHDAFVLKCINGHLAFWDFCEIYNNFYWRCAFDGHESDNEERDLFVKYESRILPHRIIAEEILHSVCSDEDAKKKAYIHAGRFGSDEATAKLKDVAGKYLRK